MKEAHRRMLAGITVLLAFCGQPAPAAVTVYEFHLSQYAVRLNPSALLPATAMSLTPVIPVDGVTDLPVQGGLHAGDGFLYVEGSHVEYYLAMSSGLGGFGSLSFESTSTTAQLLLGASQHYDFSPGVPRLSGYMTVIGPDGVEQQEAIYISSFGIDPRDVFTGSVDDPALAALLAQNDIGVTVYANSDTGIYHPSGALIGAAAPEPGRAFLLFLGIASMLRRRRRALGSGSELSNVPFFTIPRGECPERRVPFHSQESACGGQVATV